jgi:hypothetical protein
MTMRLKISLKTLVALGLLVGGITSPAAAGTAQNAPAPPDAPDFQLQTVEGKPFQLAAHKGTVRVLFFVRDNGHFVPRVLSMIESIVGSSPSYQKGSMLICIVAHNVAGMELETLREKFNLEWVLLKDPDRRVHRLYKVIAVPTVVIVDREGRIAERFAGYTLSFGAEFRTDLRRALGLPALRTADDVSTATRRADRYVSIGELMEKRGIWTSALRSYQNALEIDPELHEARLGVGYGLLHTGRPKEAAEEFRRLLDIDTLTTQSQVGLAWSDALLGKVKEASATLEKLRIQTAGLPEYHEAWAAVYSAQGNEEAADAANAKAESLRGGHVRAPVTRPTPMKKP